MTLDVIVEEEAWNAFLGEAPQALAERVLAAIAARDGVVSILFADDGALQQLNRDFRGKDAPTNVLAFPAPAGFDALGDIALALETVAREAEAQGKSAAQHAAHLIAHGVLHLLGYDHETDDQAAEMEAQERAILARLGFPDPYE